MQRFLKQLDIIMIFSKLTIVARLAVGFGVGLVILIIVSVLSISKLASLNESLIVTVDFNGVELNTISQVLGEAQKASTAMRNVIILSDLPRMTKEREAFEKSSQSYEKFTAALNKIFLEDPNASAEEKNYLMKITEAKTATLPLIKKAFDLGFANDPKAPDVLMGETGPALDKLVNTLIEFRDYEIKTSDKTFVRNNCKCNCSA